MSLDTTADSITAEDAGTSQFLTFQIAGEEYALDILVVQEIRSNTAATRVPNSPPHVTGVLNLRGAIVPLFDLRAMFNLPACEYDQFAAIIVVNSGRQVTGLIVDRVSEVITALDSDIQPAPEIGKNIDDDAIRGILRHEEKLIIVLDAISLLGDEENSQ
ncbi:MAG TPA: chemotaxis protein CheW [Capsulimonadaceae bacterium]|jgi:purine-binding chemotaxis protein CheW